MSREDAFRWNQRYQEEGGKWPLEPREFLLRFHHLISTQGLVLDVAMGLGGNACFLQNQGFRVVGLDISSVAVCKAKERCPRLMAMIADACQIAFPQNTFDAILNFYFLNRSLFSLYREVLKPGGLLLVETPCVGTREAAGYPFPEEFLLKNNELLASFPDWDILYSNRSVIHSNRIKIVQKMILRKA